MAFINIKGALEEIEEKPYFHLVPSITTTFGHIFYNNLKVGKGLIVAISKAIESEPQLRNAQSGYSLFHLNKEKENVFEEIRKADFPEKPSRMKALFVFESQKDAERAQMKWFANEDRKIHLAWIRKGAKIHVGDSNWLNCEQNRWQKNAERYWKEEKSTDPFIELVVHGYLYFPDWERITSAQEK